MDTIDTIKIPKLTGNGKEWFELTGSTAFKNVGATAEVGYSTTGSAPTVFKGESVLQGEVVDTSRGVVYVLQDSYFSYEFIASEIDTPAYIISESTTKTVGVGKDFETLHEALRWVEGVTQAKGQIILTLDDGIHVIGGQAEFDDWNWNYYSFRAKNFKIASTSGNKADCTITLDAWDDDDSWADIIDLYGSSYLNISNITVDMTLNGYPYPNIYPLNAWENSTISLYQADIKNCGVGVYVGGASVSLYGVNIDACDTGILLREASLSFRDLICTNMRIALSAQNLSSINGTNFTATDFRSDGTGITVQVQSSATFWGTLSISSAINKLNNGLRIDENSQMFFDNTTVNSLEITNATNGMHVQGNSRVGSEYALPIIMTDCTVGINATYGSSVYFVSAPTFVNTPTEYNIPLNTVTNESSQIIIGRTVFALQNGFSNYSDGTADLADSTPALIAIRGSKSLVTVGYLLSAEFGASLPIADPLSVGKMWNNAGVLTISAG